MNTVEDLSLLQPRVVADSSQIERLRWFQLQRYFEGGLVDDLPSALPPDPLVETSTYFGIYADGEAGAAIQATARIVLGDGLPPLMEHHRLFPHFDELIGGLPSKVCEISRLAVDTSCRYFEVLALLSREFLRYTMRNPESSLLVASVEKPLVRILNRLLGVPLQIMGPSIESYGDFAGECVPILIDSAVCLDTFRRQDSRRWEFFLEDLVIDLTV